MSKIKTPWRKRTVDTGIYQRTAYDCTAGAQGEPCDGMAQVYGGNLQSWLARIEQAAREAAENPVNENAAHHAASALWDVARLREWLERNAHIERSPNPEDCGTALDAIHAALALGQAAERLNVAPHERDAARGKKVKLAASQGAAAVNGSQEQRRKADAEIAAAFAKVFPAQVRKKMQAYRMVGAMFGGIAAKTVSRALTRHAQQS